MAGKSELVAFLDRRVFEPILRAPKRTGHEGEELQDVQRRTRDEQARFHGYPTAEKVVEMFKDDLHSEKARPVNARLKRLHLPVLADVREEFIKLAGE